MSLKTIGCIELNSIAIGILTADTMIKAAAVELLTARPTCPGRYLIMISGDTGAVTAAVEVGRATGGDMVIDWFSLASIHPAVLPALSGTGILPAIQALGVIETYSTASCILAADAAAKAGQIDIIEIRSAAGLAGKAFVTISGDVGSVEASVQAGIERIRDTSPIVSHIVIPSPAEELKRTLV